MAIRCGIGRKFFFTSKLVKKNLRPIPRRPADYSCIKEQATLTMGDVNVFLGTSDDMNGKISELHDMLPQIEGLKGTLYLDTYDELKTDTMFSFIQE